MTNFLIKFCVRNLRKSLELKNILYYFKKKYYRYRLHKRFKKYTFYGPWEMTDYPLIVSFECFCEFYENGDIGRINWNSDEHHNYVKSEMDYLYKWWTKERNIKANEIETVLDEWNIRHVMYWEKLEGGYYQYGSINTKYTRYLFELHSKLEKEYYEDEKNNFIRLVKIRDFLST